MPSFTNSVHLHHLTDKVIGKPFDITEYGVCYIEDMLGEVAENSLVVRTTLMITS